MSGSSKGKTPEVQDEYPDADRRRDDALKRALNMPPKPHAPKPKKPAAKLRKVKK